MIKALSANLQKLLTTGAQSEARRTGSEQLLPEHVILALLKSSEGVAYNALQALNINLLSLQFALEQSLPVSGPIALLGDIPPSKRLRVMLDVAAIESNAAHRDFIGTEHFLLASIREEKSVMSHFFKNASVTPDEIRSVVARITGADNKNNSSQWVNSLERQTSGKQNSQNINEKQSASYLAEFSRDITEKARSGELDPVVGRDKEIQRVIQILARRTKNNPVLIGEPGVGKTAIVEGLAQNIVSENVPRILLNKKIFTLDLGQVIAGTKFRGEFEERIKRIMKELRENKNIILFIDELHTLIGAGSGEGTMDASNMLKPALSRGELQCIGATTLKEYRKYFEKDAALERRFQMVKVEEPNDKECEMILEGIKPKYEKYHGVKYEDDVIKTIVKLSRRYLTERFMPDKAIDLLDEAGAMKKVEVDPKPKELDELEKQIEQLSEQKKALVQNQNYEAAAGIRDEVRELKKRFDSISEYWHSNISHTNTPVTSADVCKVISLMTGIPLNQLDANETSRLVNMEEEIHKTVIGQHEAISAISSAIRRSRSGVSSGRRPSGSFLFLGPTGVGKTLLAKTLSKFLFGNEDALIRIDMSDYMEKHNASRLVGAPPGYVGYEEGGILTEKVRRNPYCVILLDEIEKAHHDVFNLLLQVLEEGELTDTLGHVVNFRNAVIIMTSNAGAKQITAGSTVGFNPGTQDILTYKEIKTNALAELKKIMSPELLNRIDDILVFTSLSREEIAAIMENQIAELSERINELGICLSFTEEAKTYLIENGYDPSYGARPMRRLIQREIEDKIATQIISGTCTAGDTIVIDCTDNAIELNLSKNILEVTKICEPEKENINN